MATVTGTSGPDALNGGSGSIVIGDRRQAAMLSNTTVAGLNRHGRGVAQLRASVAGAS